MNKNLVKYLHGISFSLLISPTRQNEKLGPQHLMLFLSHYKAEYKILWGNLTL
jgi:hypothetical protein